MPFHRGTAPLALLLAATFGAAARAETAPPYQELLRAALASGPRTQEAAADIERSQALARQAAVRPNPTASLEVENFAGSGPFHGFDAAETTVSVEQVFELGGKRSARRAAAESEVDAARARAAETGAELAFDLAQAYAAAEVADARLILAREAQALAEDDLRVAKALVVAGKEADVRAVQAAAAAETAKAVVGKATAERTEALAKLAAAAGSPDVYSGIGRTLLTHADHPEAPAAAALDASTTYRRALAEREAAFRRLTSEQRRRTPDLSASIGVRHLAGDDSNALVGGVSAPLPLFDRNAGAAAAAQAEVRAAEARLRAARLEAESAGRILIARLAAAQGGLTAAKASEASADEAYRLTRLGYEGGKLPLTEVLSARRALAEARSNTLTARLERLDAEAALARQRGETPFGDLS